MWRCALLVLLVFRVAGCGGSPEEVEWPQHRLEPTTAPSVDQTTGLPIAWGLPAAESQEEEAPPLEVFGDDEPTVLVSPVHVAEAFADSDIPWLQEFVFQAYRENGWKPLFVDPHYNIEPVTDYLRMVLAVHELGLNPFDFNMEQLIALTRRQCRVDFADGEQVAELEQAVKRWIPEAPESLLTVRCQNHWWPEDVQQYDAWLTASYFKLAYALSGDDAAVLKFDGREEAVAYLVSLLPESRRYFARVAAFRRFMPFWSTASLPTMGKWGSLEPGVVGPRVAKLKMRLVAEGFMDRETYLKKRKIFDKPTRTAVKAYRKAYGLTESSKVDRKMLGFLSLDAKPYLGHLWRSLNATITGRTERGDAYILVNIPEYLTHWVVRGTEVATYRSVVGFPYEEPGGRTPEVHATIDYVDLNPEWVPSPYTVKHELKKKARKEKGFFKKNNFIQRGDKWVQLPGPQNTLGQVVIAFGSDKNIYLHGTPEKKYFGYADRALSHGCVRVENIEDLASRVLAWAGVKLQPGLKRVLKKVVEKRVEMPRNLPVYFIYDRVRVTEAGLVGLTPDPYKLDRKLSDKHQLDPLHTLMAMARKTRRLARR